MDFGHYSPETRSRNVYELVKFLASNLLLSSRKFLDRLARNIHVAATAFNSIQDITYAMKKRASKTCQA